MTNRDTVPFQIPRARFTLDVGYASDVGTLRKRNEDSFAVYQPPSGEENDAVLQGLLLVADGMGGERGGDRASQMAAEGLHQCFASGLFQTWPEHSGPNWRSAVLQRAIREVNDEIYRLGENDPLLEGLGTTVVIVLVTFDEVTIAHVGDSRCYRIRGARVEQMTTDHTWVEGQVAAGILSREEAREHPNRNILIRSLGDAIAPGGDVRVEALQDGDLFLLCSDGLTGSVTEAEILQWVHREPDPQALAEALVQLANTKDGSDNITVVIGRCREITLAEHLPTPSPSENRF